MPAFCWPSVPMIVTYTSATDRSGLTFTRVMLGMPVRRGSFSSRMMMFASSFWIVLPSISVRLDIFVARASRPRSFNRQTRALAPVLQQFNLVIDQARLWNHPNEIDELAEGPFHVAFVVAHH